MPLRGIRLKDLYGYQENDYNSFYDNNLDNIKLTTTKYKGQDYTEQDEDDVASEMYLNRLIKDKAGIDAYNNNVRGKGFDAKMEYYNSLFDNSNNSIENDEMLQFDDNINPNKLEQPRTMFEYFKSKVGDSYDNSDVNDLDIFDKLYNRDVERVGEELYNSALTNSDVDNYAADIKNRLDNDSQLAYDYFSRFDKQMMEVAPYYKRYHDTDLIDFSANQMKDIMAKYYSIMYIKNEAEANKYAAEVFQNEAAKNQGFLKKLYNTTAQAASNFIGDLASVVGIVGGTPEALYNATVSNKDIKDLSWLEEFAFYLSQNPVVQYGNNIIETGALLPSQQQAIKDAGLAPIELIRQYGHESDFLNINTLFELPAQATFTIAGMLTGGAASKLLTKTIGKTLNGVSRKMMTEGAKSFARNSGRYIDALGKGIVVGGTAALPAAAEASMDAIQTYDNLMSDSSDILEQIIQKQVDDDLENGTFNDYYWNNSTMPFMQEILNDSNSEIKLSQEERDQLVARQQQEWDNMLQQYKEEKRQALLEDNELMNTIQQTAARAAGRNMLDETLFIAFGDALFTEVLGGRTKAIKNQIKRSLGRQSDFELYRDATDALRVKQKPKNALYYAKTAGRGVFEAGQEGFEELFQNVDTQLRQDLANDYISKWEDSRYDSNALKSLRDIYWGSWDVVNKSLGENLLSEESVYSFLMGAVSAGIGTPTIVNGVMSSRAAKEAGIKRSGWETFFSYLRNPIAERIIDSNTKYNHRQQELNDINRWLEEHDEVARIKDLNSLVSWVQKQKDAVVNDDEADFRDALMGQKIATIMMMDRVGGSAKEKSFSAKMRQLANLNYNDAEAQDIITQAAIGQEIQNPTEEQRHEIFDDIKKKAQDLVNLQNDVHNTKKWINSNFGDIIGSEAVDAWTYETIMQRDIKQRISDINQSVKDAFQSSLDSRAVGYVNPVENAIARYGSIANAQNQLASLQSQLNAVKNNKKSIIESNGKTFYKSQLNSISDRIKAIKEDITVLNNNDANSVVVRAEQIAALDTDARAAIVDSKNRNNYSTTQRAEIDKFLATDTITKDVLDEIRDADKLQKKYTEFNKRFKELQRNSENAILYNNEINRQVMRKYAEKGLADAVNAEDYESFKSAVDKFFNDDKYSFAAPMANDVLKNNKFFKQYSQEIQKRQSAIDVMSNSPAYKNLSEDQKRLLTQAYYRALADGDTSFDNIYKYLSDKVLREKLGIKDDIIDGEFISNVRDILKAIDTHQKVIDAFNNHKEALAKQAEEEKEPQDYSGNEDIKVINNNIYNKYKERLTSIIGNLVNYLRSRVRNIAMSKDDFVTFIKCYSENDFENNFLIDDFTPTLREKELYELSQRLKEACDKKAYVDENAANDEQFNNTMAFAEAIDRMLALAEFFKNTTGTNDIKAFIKNSLIQQDPTWENKFNAQIKGLKNISTRLGTFSFKKEDTLSTEAEKKYYKDNNIQKNLETAAKLNNSLPANDKLSTVFIYDDTLGNAILDETGEQAFTSDNLPLIGAVIVPANTEGSKVISGINVLPIGLVKNSRSVPSFEPTNGLNELRSLAMVKEQVGVIKNADNSIYQCKGIQIRTSDAKPEGNPESLRDFLLQKHNGNVEEAIEDYKQHVVRVESTIDHNTRIVTATYKFNGKPYTMTYPANEGSWLNTMKEVHVQNAYIDELEPTRPRFLFSKMLSQVTLSDGRTLYEVFNSGELLSNKKFEHEDINNIRNAINFISERVGNNIDSIVKYGGEKEENQKFFENLSFAVSKQHINLDQKSVESKPNIQLSFSYKDGIITMYATGLDDTGDRRVVSQASAPNGKISKIELKKLAQEGLKNIIFEDDGSVRMKSDGYPLVKLQIKDNDARTSSKMVNGIEVDTTNNSYIKQVFLMDGYKMRASAVTATVDEILVNETSQNVVSETGNAKIDALVALDKFKKIGDGSKQKVPGSIGVTTFINGGVRNEDEIEPVKNEVAKSLGTSVDTLVRIYFQKGNGLQGVLDWMKEQGISTWFGFGGQATAEFTQFVKEVGKIEQFFAEREETPVTEEHIFSGELKAQDGSVAKITAIPDIITVDKNGKYHIYDMKSFRYAETAVSAVPGFNNTQFYINGLRYSEDLHISMDKWQQQLSLYKAIIEHYLGNGCIASLGVIPIALTYSLPEGTAVGNKTVNTLPIGDQIREVKVPFNGDKNKMVNFRISLKRNREMITTVAGKADFIKIAPIDDIRQISSNMWTRQNSKPALDIKDKKEPQKPINAEQLEPDSPPVVRSSKKKPSAKDLRARLLGGEKSTVLNTEPECD